MKLIYSLLLTSFFTCNYSYSQYSGTYTAGGTGYFTSLTAACDSIEANGIDGPVVIDIIPGTYLERIQLLGYSGGSVTNTITFRAENGVLGSVTIEAGNTIHFQDTTVGHILIENLVVNSTGGNAVHIWTNSHDITVQGCELNGIPIASASASAAVINFFRVTGNMVFEDCTINEGSYGLHVDDQSLLSIRIANNTFRGFHAGALRINRADSITVVNNDIETDAQFSYSSGLIYYDAFTSVANIHYNRLVSEYGSNCTGIRATGAFTSYITNNMISLTGNNTKGIYLGQTYEETYISNNSIRTGGTCFVGDLDAENVFIHNNIFYNYNGGYIYYLDYNDFATAIPISDNNAWYTSGPFYAYADIPYSSDFTYTEYQQAFGVDSNSFLLADPQFVSNTNLHTCNDSLSGVGTSAFYSNLDFDGESRVGLPSIGADYFIGNNTEFLGEDLLICSGQSLSIDDGNQNEISYLWSTGESTPQISINNAGTYWVEIIATCGIVSDTVVVTSNDPIASFNAVQSYFTFSFSNTSQNGTSYLWDFGDGNSSTDENPIHIYSTQGTYTVTLSITNDCGTVMYTEDITPSTVGLDEDALLAFVVYPNPSQSGIFTIDFDGKIESIQLLDITGRLVHVTIDLLNKKVDASSLESGKYFMQLRTATATTVKQIVISK